MLDLEPLFDVISPDGTDLPQMSEAWIRAHYPDDADGMMLAAIKVTAADRVHTEAERYRGKFVRLMPGKLAEYQVKAPLALAAIAGDAAALALLSGEATVRGLTPIELANVIDAKAKEYTATVMVIAELEAKATADIEIAVTPNDVVAVLTVMNGMAQAKFAEIITAQVAAQGGA